MMKKISRHMSLIVLAVQIVLMTALSVAATVIVSKNAEKNSVEHMKAISDSKSAMIDEYMDYVEQMLEFYSISQEIINAAKHPDSPEAAEAAQKFTEEFSSRLSDLEGVYVSEWDTRVIAHTNRSATGMVIRTGESLDKLRQQLCSGADGCYNAGIIASPVSGRQVVSVYRALTDENGEYIGLAGLGIYTSGLVSRLSQVRYEGFENADFCIVSAENEKYVFSDDPEKISGDAENGTVKELCRKLADSGSSETGSFRYTDSVSGEKYVSVYRYIPERKWLLVVSDLKNEVFSLSVTMKIYLFAFGLAIIVITFVISYIMRNFTIRLQSEMNEKEKKHRDDTDAILSALPESCDMAVLDITDDVFLTYHGSDSSLTEKISSGDKSDAVRIARDAVISRTDSSEQKKNIGDILDRDSLIKSFEEKNIKHMSCNFSSLTEDGGVNIMELTVSMLQNMVNGNTEAVIQISDVSDEYYKNIVGKYLTVQQFIFTTIVFIKTGRGRSLANNTDMGTENIIYDYDDFLDDIYNGLIDRKERDAFREKMSLENIRNALETEKTYSVMVHTVSDFAGKRYLNYEFQYIDDTRNIVLLCLGDVTSVWETDILTGLNNYKGFVSQAQYVLEKSSESEEFAVIVTNIKWFKVINRIFGAQRCDEFLKAYAETLQNSALEPVVTGRFSASDHFIMLVRKEKVDTDEIVRLSHQHIVTDERDVDVLITCGIYYISDRSMAVSDMVDHASTASKSIRDVYNLPYSVFSELEEERYLSGKLVVSEFEKSLRKGEFLPFYQPIFDAVTHKVVSAEALVRWKKDGSFIPPGMFIPALEENGNVSRVDLHISDCVTEFLIKRKSEGKKIVPVSVNLSVMDFYANDTINGVMNDIGIMNEHGIVPRYEITETAWADASDNRNEIINTMREKGTQILIDDFGSGYSSFSTIRDFSFDILKIDMGFIRKIGTGHKADGIVTSIIDMAHFIGLKVVAEGVETKEHLKFLTEHGCDYIQGYYFSKPLPEEEFEKLLDEE